MSLFFLSCPVAPGFCVFPPTAESFGVSAQIGSGVVRGGAEVPRGFHQGFHEVLRGLVRALERAHAVGEIT